MGADQNSTNHFNTNTEAVVPWTLPVDRLALVRVIEDCFKAKVANLSAIQIGESGFLSVVIKAHVTWTIAQSSDSLPASLIVKFPSLMKIEAIVGKDVSTDVNDKLSEFLQDSHNRECEVYEYLNNSTLDKKIPVPLLFNSKKTSKLDCTGSLSSYLIFGDLSTSGVTLDIVEGLNLNQCRNVLQHIATVHAFSRIDQSWKSIPELQKKVEEMKSSEAAAQRQGFIKSTLESVRNAFPEIVKITDEVLQPFLDNSEFLRHCHGEQDSRVLVHGDLWMNNVMFKTDIQTGRASDEVLAVLDWQMINDGSCIMDVAFLLVSSLDYRLRKIHGFELLNYYYEQFTAVLNSHNQPIPFTLETLQKRYQSTLGFVAIQLFLQSSLIVKPHSLKKYSMKQMTDFIERYQSILIA